MKIYMAGDSMTEYQRVSIGLVEREYPQPWRILMSWYYYKNGSLDEILAKYLLRPYPELFLDSGAFSALMQGVHISIDEYAEWICKYRHLISLYANLDVIKNAEATLKNQERLEKVYKLSPLPVFHVSEPWEILDYYLDRYSYIALGVAGTRSHVYMPWLVKCFKRAEGRPVVYHGFGITTWETLKAFPWYSVDSSSWGNGFRYGKLRVFDEKLGKFFEVLIGNHASCYKYASIIRSYGFDPQHFSKSFRLYRQHMCVVGALSCMKAEQWLERLHGVVAIPERNEVIS